MRVVSGSGQRPVGNICYHDNGTCDLQRLGTSSLAFQGRSFHGVTESYPGFLISHPYPHFPMRVLATLRTILTIVVRRPKSGLGRLLVQVF